jgi:hypothetical protein
MDHTENTLATTTATDAAGETGNQAQAAKTYTQDEVDNMMARMRGSLEKKLLKPYEGLGDPDELRQLREQAQKREQEAQLKRGEFDKIIQDLAAKKDAEIQKRDKIITEYKVNTPILSAAAQYGAVNAEQVRQLLSQNVRLNADGEVEVVDTSGSVRYTDSGKPLGVSDLVQEFLTANPHFKAATPSTTNTKTNISQTAGAKIDISKLDLRNPEQRKLYAQARGLKA